MCTEDSPSGLWRTLGKRVGCKPSGVRIPHPPPPDPGTASGSGVFVACDAAGVPGAVGPGRLDGPGRCVCRWAAARPRAVRAASFARRVASKPGQAPPPPTGTAAGPSGALHTGGTCVAWTSPARPRHRPPAPRPGPPDPPEPSTPAVLVVLCASAGNRAFIARLCSGRVALRLRGPRRSLRPGARPGPHPSQRASIGAGPSRCSSIRPRTPSRSGAAMSRVRPPA